MPSIFQTLPLGASQTGLTLTTSVYTGSTLSTSTSATESPASSGRYTFTFTSPATAATYDWSMQDASGTQWGSGGFETDSAGNLINNTYLADGPANTDAPSTLSEATAAAGSAATAASEGASHGPFEIGG